MSDLISRLSLKQSIVTSMILADEKTLEQIIDEEPSVDPVKHGRWIEEPNCWYRCSICGNHYPSIRGYMDYNYCPSCGTRMDGEQNG